MKATEKKRFRDIKARIADLHENCGSAIDDGKVVLFACDVVMEMRWLIDQSKRYSKGREELLPKDFKELSDEVAGLCSDHARAVDHGKFVALPASIVTTMGKLAKGLDKLLTTPTLVEVSVIGPNDDEDNVDQDDE